MTNTISWHKEYTAGNKEFSLQHKNLVELIFHLPDDMDIETINLTLMFLYKHSKNHFKNEEKLMAQKGYPFAFEHKDHHSFLLKQLGELSKSSYDKNSSGRKLREMLIFWFEQHFLNYDKNFTNYLKTLVD